MIRRRVIIAVSVLLGAASWLFHATFVYFLHDADSLWDPLILDVSLDDVFIRSVAIVAFLAFGLALTVGLTRQKRSEIALRESEERFRRFFERQPAYCYMISPEGVILDVNDSALKALGYKKEELVGEPLETIYAPEVVPRMKQLLAKWQRTGELRDEEMVIITKGGDRHVVLLSAGVVKDKDGKLLHSISMQNDITERKRMQDALKESEERYRSLFEHAAVPMCRVGEDGSFLLVNQRFAALTGYSEDELTGGMGIGDIAAPEETKKLLKYHRRRRKGHQVPARYETTLVTKDGQHREVMLSVGLIPGSDEDVTILEDITAKRQADRALRESEERYRTTFENTGTAMVMMEEDTTISLANSGFERLSGYSREETEGKKKWTEFVLLEDLERMVGYHYDRRKKEGKAPTQYEFRFVTRDGTVRNIMLNVNMIPGTTRSVASLLDITERRQVEEELLRYQKQLRRLGSELSLAEERERKQLAADLHDRIGHALALLKMKLEGLAGSSPAADLKDGLNEISDIVGSAIDEARSLTFEISPPVLYQLGLEPALEWLAEPFQEQYGIPCSFEDDGSPKPLEEDVKVTLFRSARELLANVAKHAHAGNVKVSIWRDVDDVYLQVEDDGVGFDTSTISSFGAAEEGYGLFSMRERVEHIGGYSQIESRPGKGTTVTLVAPLKMEEETPQED